MTWIRLVELFCSCVFQLLLFFWFTQCNVTGPLDDNSPKCRFPLEVSTLEGNELIEWENWARYQLMSVGSDLLGKFSYLQLHDIDPSEFVSTFHLEAGLLEHIYRRVDSCRKHFESAEMAAGPRLSVTGVLGFRTVHQVEPKAQMVLVANTSSSNTSDVCPSINQVTHTHDSTIGVLLYCFGMEAAMALNSLYPDGWFALGAAALKARDVERLWMGLLGLFNLIQTMGKLGKILLAYGTVGNCGKTTAMLLWMWAILVRPLIVALKKALLRHAQKSKKWEMCSCIMQPAYGR
ncbi:hypothetical protein KPL70_012441 [Citrus sinensis]|nr:hypothetical protein KPL70_012441 [Citrus sinensis]